MKINQGLVVSALVVMIIYFSCRKIDQKEELPTPVKKQTVTEKFFTIPISTNPIVKTIPKVFIGKTKKISLLKDS